jgi:flagellar basal body-associated protein FliL
MVPKEVMTECREKARNAMEPSASKRTRCLVAAIVVAIWCLLAALVILLVFTIADL